MDSGVPPKPIPDPTAIAVDGGEPRRLAARQHVQAYALAFYQRVQGKLDIEADNARKFATRVNLDGTVTIVVLMSIYDPLGRLLVPKGTTFIVKPPPPPPPDTLVTRLRDRLAGEMIRGAARIVSSQDLQRTLMALYTRHDAALRRGA